MKLFKGRLNVLYLTAFIFFMVILVHTVRNLSVIYFVFYLLLVFFLVLLSLNRRYFRIKRYSIFLLYICFLVFSLWVAFWSFIYNPEVSFITTVSRLFFITVVPLVLIMFDFNEEEFNSFLKLFVFVVIGGALSYFYQFFLGPVSWLNAPGAERAGLMRFSTILGSLTVYGVVVGMALYVTYFIDFDRKVKFFIFTTLFVGSFLSMQKAAFINIGLAIIFILFSASLKNRVKLLLGGFLFFVSLVLIAFLYQNSFISIYFQSFLLNTLGINLFDNAGLIKTEVLSKDLLLERLLGLHFIEIMNQYGWLLTFMVGLGATGAGGAMGVESLQAHNSFWDLYFMGGFLYLSIFLGLYACVQYALYKMDTSMSNVFFILNIMFAVNSLSSSISMFHPVISFCFWVSVVYVLKK